MHRSYLKKPLCIKINSTCSTQYRKHIYTAWNRFFMALHNVKNTLQQPLKLYLSNERRYKNSKSAKFIEI